ncbi:MAG: hypothetical protein EAZ37_09440 [Burkholderiales bacterium]|nr:MAG: hypothetical protein EAZ37_09440 [Burkholderiales bacterium]
MKKIFSNAINSIAACALSMPIFCLFSFEISAQTVSEALIKRIEASSQRISPVRAKAIDTQQSYALEKAQCWLDFSKHEALRNNPTQVPELAHQKATQLLGALEAGSAPAAFALNSSLLGDDKRMRNDLWAQLEVIKSSKQMACAAKEVACSEVMLVQAAHAHERIDWRYAQPYFGMAEDGVRAAKKQAAACPLAQ